MKRQYRKYTDQDVIEAAKNVKSIAGLLKELNLVAAGGNYINIKRILQKLNINTDHWTGQGWRKDRQLKDYKNYVKVRSIRKHLIKERGNICNNCKLTKWINIDIPLELHHIDGDRTNNEKVNLEFLCPNCHALTENWRNKKR